MKENQIVTLQEWPIAYGGGTACVNLMIAQILRILNLPYAFVVINIFKDPLIHERLQIRNWMLSIKNLKELILFPQ